MNKALPEETKQNPPKIYKIAAPMKNDIGEQNCFVNVVVHAFHYIPEIYEYLKKENINHYSTNYNLLKELYKLLTKYNKLTSCEECKNISEQDRYCDVYDLRKELESIFKGEVLFQLNIAGDPIDLLFTFLNAFHSFNIKANSLKYSIDKECKPTCPSHELFGLNLVQQYECKSCKGTSDILKFAYNYFIYEIPMKDLLLPLENINTLSHIRNKLFQYAKESNSKTAAGCPSKCSHPKVIKNIIMINPSSYLSFSLSWKEINPKLTDICKAFFMIPSKLNNGGIFDIYNKELSRLYDLYGMICYWGGHHVCFFKSLAKEEGQLYWIFHDDRTVVKITTWKEIIIQCVKSHYHPIMLFYKDTGSKASYFEDAAALTDIDYRTILSHCEKVENEDKGNVPDSPVSKIRPGFELKKSNDIELQRAIASFQQLEELKNKKNESFDETNDEGYIELNEDVTSLNKSSWKCSLNQCNNYNNYSTFQCVKCQAINIKVYQIIQTSKEIKGIVKINTENKANKYDSLNKSTMNLQNTQRSLKSNQDPLISSNEIIDKETKPIICIPSSLLKQLNSYTWKCHYCFYLNPIKIEDSCLKCKRNKSITQKVIKSASKKVNGVKHYL